MKLLLSFVVALGLASTVSVQQTTVITVNGRALPGAKIPKGGTLNFPFGRSEVTDRAGTVKVLQRLVATFNRSYPDGAQFTVLDQDGMLYVIPKSSRSAGGTVGPFTSPLDVPITVVVTDVPGDVALKAILDAVKNATGTTLLMGLEPINGLKRATVSISNGGGDRARTPDAAPPDRRTIFVAVVEAVGDTTRSPHPWTDLLPSKYQFVGAGVNRVMALR